MNDSSIFDIREYYLIKREISNCHSFYNALFNIAECSFSTKIPTAAVSYDKQGNFLSMLINPDFWKKLDNEEKNFVILHELSHIIYDHGKRFLELKLDHNIANIAQDIIINHRLYEYYGIHRENFDWEQYCWVETCLPNQSIPTNKSFEYYYNLLKKQKTIPKQNLLGSHDNNSSSNDSDIDPLENINSNDDKSEINKEDNETKKNNESMSEFSDDFKDILSQNPEILKEFKSMPDVSALDKKHIHETIAPNVPLGEELSGETSSVQLQEPPDFEKLMKILLPPKRKKLQENVYDSWIGDSRRYMDFITSNKNLSLPNQNFKEKKEKPKKKQVWVFIDNSGSCSSMFHTFATIAISLMKNSQVECRGFTFGDSCDEIKLSENMKINFYSGNAGGFDCIENNILNIIKKENIKYPDNIVVLSDGGATFRCINNLKSPKSWIMLINNNTHKHLTPPGGKYFLCDHTFFESKSPKLNKKQKI